MSKSQIEALQRPDELEDALNQHLYHPISRRLAMVLADTTVTPNMVSVTGGLAVLGAAAIYSLELGLIGAVCGLALHMAWHVFDGADGDLARLTGQQSAMGEIVDGICDYIPHIALYLVLASLLAQQIGAVGWLLMIATGFARMVQAAFYETQRRQYQSWVYAKTWLRQEASEQPVPNGVMQILVTLYLRLSDVLSAGGRTLDKRLFGLPADQNLVQRQVLREKLTPLMRFILPLSANYRTLVIGIAMALAMPLSIVIFEFAVLSLWLVISLVFAQRKISSILSST